MQLTSYDTDMLRDLCAANFDLSTLAYNRYLRYDQVLWWSRQPHIADAISQTQQNARQKAELDAQEQAQKKAPASPARAQSTSSLRHFITSSLSSSLRAAATSQHTEERNHIFVFGEDAVVVEVDVLAAQDNIARRGVAAGENVEEVDDVLVFGEDAVVVEVDVVAGRARAACEDGEEVGDVLVFGEDAVVVEVDGVAACIWRLASWREQLAGVDAEGAHGGGVSTRESVAQFEVPGAGLELAVEGGER